MTSRICCANIGTCIIFCPKKAPLAVRLLVLPHVGRPTPTTKTTPEHQKLPQLAFVFKRGVWEMAVLVISLVKMLQAARGVNRPRF